MITDQNGDEDWNMFFLYGNGTEVYHSCSIVWNNEMFVLGGETEKRQISKIYQCELKRIGDLSFEHDNGGCTVALQSIILCFGDSDANQCYQSHKGPTGLG